MTTKVRLTLKLIFFYLLFFSTGTFNFFNSAGLAYEADEVKDCIKDGKLESERITHSETLQLSKLMDNLRSQLGVVFDSDK